jgi:hypothetical protein
MEEKKITIDVEKREEEIGFFKVLGRGVEISMSQNGKPLIPDKDDCLGVLPEGKIEAIIKVNRRLRGEIECVVQYGPLHAVPKYDFVESPDPLLKIHRQIIPVYPVYVNERSRPYTKHPENMFKIIEMFQNGKFRVYEVAIVSRIGGKFYITTQLAWNEQCYRDNQGKLWIPSLYEWHSLREVCEKYMDPKELEPDTKYVPKDKITAAGLADNEGRVLYFSHASGTGAIITKIGPAKVYWLNIVQQGFGLVSLNKGDKVTYKRLQVPANNQRTQFKWEAIGVRYVPFSRTKELAIGVLTFIAKDSHLT